LLVNANAVLTGSISLQLLESIARRASQKIQCHGTVEHLKLSLGDIAKIPEST
jgi:hypothetical protein